MKKNVFLGLLVILLAFCLTVVGCDNGSGVRSRNDGNGEKEQIYTVTIGTLANGSITASPTSGIAGTEITIIINPDNFYGLKTDTLKYGSTPINETTLRFNLPAENVIVTAEFESLLNGMWYYPGDGHYVERVIIFENDYFIETSWASKGKYTIIDNILTVTPTHIHGRYLPPDFKDETKWYSKNELEELALSISSVLVPWSVNFNFEDDTITMSFETVTQIFTRIFECPWGTDFSI